MRLFILIMVFVIISVIGIEHLKNNIKKYYYVVYKYDSGFGSCTMITGDEFNPIWARELLMKENNGKKIIIINWREINKRYVEEQPND